MGGDHSDAQGQGFRKQDWQLLETNERRSIWQNRRQPSQKIEEYGLFSGSEQEYRRQKQVYYLRKNHPQLVSALHLSSQNSHQFCSSSYQQRLYIEKIPLRLSDIQHIPYPDALHLYQQALRGYAELATAFRPFEVDYQFIGINERGAVKVWLGTDFSSYHIVSAKISEENMVAGLIDLLDSSVDHSSLPPNVPTLRNYLYRKQDRLGFDAAVLQFNTYVRQFSNGFIPGKLQCIQKAGGIYAIANRDSSLQRINTQGQQYHLYQKTSSRPLLIDNSLINNEYQPQNVILTNNQLNYKPSMQFIPNLNNQLLTPSTVKDTTPIVRKQAATFHNQNPNEITQQFTPYSNISQTSRPEARIVSVPTPAVGFNPPPIQYRQVTQGYQQSIVIPQGQQFISQNIPQQIQTPRENQAKLLTSQVRQQFQPQFIRNNQPIYYQAPPPQQIIQTRPLQDVNANSFVTNNQRIATLNEGQQRIANNGAQILYESRTNTVPLTNNFSNKVSYSNAPLPVATPQPQQEQYISNSPVEAIRREVNPTVIIPSEPEFKYSSSRGQLSQQNYVSQTQNINKNPISYTQNINTDDGKSSADFWRLINEFKAKRSDIFQQQPKQVEKTNTYNYSIPSYSVSQSTQSIPQYKNPFSQQQHQQYNQPTFSNKINYEQYTSQIPSYQYNSSEAANFHQPAQQDEFGRNAVSKIVPNYNYTNTFQEKTSEPLRFQNNMQMKYSIFETDEAAPSSSYHYATYNSSLDPDLLADMNMLKS